MDFQQLINKYKPDPRIRNLVKDLQLNDNEHLIHNLCGSFYPFLAFCVMQELGKPALFVLDTKEDAAYFLNDLQMFKNAVACGSQAPEILFFPRSSRSAFLYEETDSTEVQLRAEVLEAVHNPGRVCWIVTWPEALTEKVVTRGVLESNTFQLKVGEKVNLDFMLDFLIDLGFERTDYVLEPGQFSIRGGIADVFSFANETPYRIVFDDEEVESIREFSPVSQLSAKRVAEIALVPNVRFIDENASRVPFPEFMPSNSIVWIHDPLFVRERLNADYEKAKEAAESVADFDGQPLMTPELFCSGDEMLESFMKMKRVVHSRMRDSNAHNVAYQISPQPPFSKNFDLILADLMEKKQQGYTSYIYFSSARQAERLYQVFEDISQGKAKELYFPLYFPIHEGFVDNEAKIACYTDHQIFDRYHKFRLRDGYERREAVTLKEIMDLKPGDFVTHIDHGVGRFDGLERMEVNGKVHEAVRLVYKDGDILYVSIHSLHRIAKYSGKDGAVPVMHRLGGNAWKNLKEKTKKKVKEIAIDLIRLYAKRKMAEGFAYTPDTYLQAELEASFVYEDTPDQEKATRDVKADMEAPHPMDRLICGDVGFGKTEIAIRAAFKAACDGKQVGILVPTTILALQHFQTFTERLDGFPVRVSYINRFKSAAEIKEILKDVKAGKIEILIGTHRLLSKDVEFQDLGLLIIDEEQKFGVAAKEKIRELRENIDTLTLTATPIPRTLQFSLMGARDLSIINTPPANRYPIRTELCPFNEDVMKEAIEYEMSRDGQVFFIHNRVQNIRDIADLVRRLCPGARVAIGHGQMEGHDLEKIMVGFISGRYDVLVATTIIESGLDIPNANTIIINQAQNFGLSDLHQMRGRVGRTNKQAFCYLITPSLSLLTEDARKRLKAITEFSDLGSGFNIALRDLDIRGAGNILGAEQSGFIHDMGFETYMKILQEAIEELREKELSDLPIASVSMSYVSECTIESDLGIFLPGHYVPDSAERIALYRNLAGVKNEEELMSYQDALLDRFGPLPEEAQELLSATRLKWLAKDLGIEKVVLRNGTFTAWFVSDHESKYYQGEMFAKVIDFVKIHPKACRMREIADKLTLIFPNVNYAHIALHLLRKVSGNPIA
ncbi:MAG: transcription-repair coupling factor [Bacteroidetes bacterium]|nr:transcription-repair coupling factor [Bacteroidota bacterium]MBU1717777.1 transcription-repair coupling factor [Bacteroidota bacterium]